MRSTPLRAAWTLLALAPMTARPQSTTNPPPGGILSQFSVSSFTGNGPVSITAMTTDGAGNVYVAGTASATDLVLSNAAQPAIGDGQVFRSLDRGATWQKLANPFARLSIITPDPTDPQTLFGGAPDGIYRTTDGGKTWKHVYSIMPGASPVTQTAIAVDPKNSQLVYAVQSLQFLSSQDGGESWTAQALPDSIPGLPISLWVDPQGSGAVGIGAWLSQDRGVTWNALTRPPLATQSGVSNPWRPNFTLPDPRNAGWIYAGTSAGASGQLFLSHDWGSTWTQLASPRFNGTGGPSAIQSLLPDPDVEGTLYAMASGMFNLSVDGGTSWQNPSATSVGGQLTALSRGCAGGALLAGNQLSLDFGQTWHAVPILQMAGATSGPGCALYAVRPPSTDGFVAKLAPGGGSVLWSTYLGGSAADSAAAISADNVGNVYVSGSTASPDFPVTAPRIGPQGTSNVFLTQYNPNGTLLNSIVIGGEATDTVTAMSVTPRGDVFLAGLTSSASFPVTSGALAFPPDPAPNGSPGFAIRLSFPSGVVFSANLRGIAQYPGTPLTVAAEAGGTALFGGLDGTLYRMSADGSSLTSVAQEPGAIYAMDTDSEGNVFIASVDSQLATAKSTSCSPGMLTGSVPPGDMIIAKLHTGSLSPVFATRVAGQCQALPQSMKVGPDSTVTVSAKTLGQFPTVNPVLATAPYLAIYQTQSNVIVQLDPNGALTYATYSNSAVVARGPDHAIYASASGVNGSAVLRLQVALASNPILITSAFNAFSGVPGTPTPGCS